VPRAVASRDNARINALFFDAIERIDRGANCDAAMLATLRRRSRPMTPRNRIASRRGKSS